MTDVELRAHFPVGCRVRTTSPTHLRRGTTERTGTVVGYCRMTEMGHRHEVNPDWVRVRWDGWKAMSSTGVHIRYLTRTEEM